jgi:predicted Zn-dependent peptidase
MNLQRLANRFDETVLTGTHASGLMVILVPKRGYSKTFGVFTTNFGSIDNRFRDPATGREVTVPDGVAHFLEHKLFEDAEGDVTDRFSALGASCNAFTSFAQTSYLFSTAQNAGECLDLLLGFVQKPYFTAELIAKEQGIIAQEIRMYDDDPSWRIYFDLLAALYRQHPVRLNIAGTVESIAGIDTGVLEACHRAFYRPSNMVLTVVGGFDPDDALARIERDQDRRMPAMARQDGRHVRAIPSDGAIRAREAERAMDVARPKVLLGFKDTATGGSGADVERRDILTVLLADLVFGRSSAAHDRLYREGLIDDSFTAQASVEDSFGFLMIGGDTDDPDVLERRLLEELRAFVAHGVDPAHFERVRRKTLGRFVAMFNSPESIAYAFAGGAFRGVTPFRGVEILQELDAGEVTARGRELFAEDRMARSVVRPLVAAS